MEPKRIRLDTSQVSNETLLFNMPVINSNGGRQLPQNLPNIRLQNLTSIVDTNLINKSVGNNNIIIRSANSLSHMNNNNARPVPQASIPPNNILRLSKNQPYNYSGSSNNATSGTVNTHSNMNNSNNGSGSISIPAIQVRIGSKKFKPLSSVTFKDDGILFTLKDYSFAPVLLNARAIQKCKANLTPYGYPVLFLFLESSCMRQIRNIFSLTHKEFSANSIVEFKQCITIFPYIPPDSPLSAEQMMFGLRKAFDAMVKRYPRSTRILEVISNEQVIDTLLMNSQEKPDSSDSVNNNNNNNSNPNNNNNNNANSSNNKNNNSTPNNQMVTRSNSHNDNISNNSTVNNNVSNNDTHHQQNNRQKLVQVNQPSNPPAPLLTIPNDKALWQVMQKNLVRGGLYHVMTPGSQRKYCIWDGVQLVPCLVHNTEVQVDCSYVRFGISLHACVGPVKIKPDNSAAICFSVRSTRSDKVVDICIGVQDMMVNQIHGNNQHSCVFISVTPHTSEKLSSLLELHDADDKNNAVTSASKGNAVFDCNSSDISKKYIILFLKSLHKDQEEAILNMKIATETSYLKKNTHMFIRLDLNTTLNLLAKIVENSNEEIKRSLSTISPQGPPTLEKFIKVLTVDFNAKIHNVDDDNGDDDDDDDIVMVQQELGIKCPYTQKVMQEPVRNKKCGHNYEKQAILQFIDIKKGNAKCPYAGCANAECLTHDVLEDNLELKQHIESINSLQK